MEAEAVDAIAASTSLILTHNFFRYRSWFEAFPYLFIGCGARVV